MTTKKTQIVKGESDKINLAQPIDIAVKREIALFGKGKSVEQIIEERGIKPLKDDSDFTRIFGGYKEWFDVDEFLKEAHGSWK